METLYREPNLDQSPEQNETPSFASTELGATALESLAVAVDESSFTASEGFRVTRCSVSGSSPHQMVQDD